MVIRPIPFPFAESMSWAPERRLGRTAQYVTRGTLSTPLRGDEPSCGDALALGEV
jgi:hypothetical protein